MNYETIENELSDTTSSRPKDAGDIFSYVDPRDYLRHLLGKKKGLQLAAVAKSAGLKSPSLLSMILSGQRTLSESVADKLAKSLGLKGSRRSYFLAMGKRLRAKTPSEKADAFEEMLKLGSRKGLTLLQLQQFRFLSNWYSPVLYIMSGMRKFQAHWEVKWLSSVLGRGVSPTQVRMAIDDLTGLGLLTQDGEKLERLISNPETGEDVKSSAIHRYHQQMIEISKEALDLPLDQREINGLTIAIPENQIALVKERLRNFRRELNDYLTPFEAESERVFQINLHLFPLSEALIETENDPEKANGTNA